MVNRQCEFCSKAFRVDNYIVAKGWGRFCSPRCHQEVNLKNRPITQMQDGSVTFTTGRGTTILVSNEDIDLTSLLWHEDKWQYIRRRERLQLDPARYRTVLMHRQILARVIGRPLTSLELVDHINGQPMDNRRENLRIASSLNNQHNQGIRKSNTSGYKGVHSSRNRERWVAKLYFNYNSISVGTFDTAAKAAWMYDQWAIALHGDFANLNFEYV